MVFTVIYSQSTGSIKSEAFDLLSFDAETCVWDAGCNKRCETWFPFHNTICWTWWLRNTHMLVEKGPDASRWVNTMSNLVIKFLNNKIYTDQCQQWDLTKPSFHCSHTMFTFGESLKNKIFLLLKNICVSKDKIPPQRIIERLFPVLIDHLGSSTGEQSRWTQLEISWRFQWDFARNLQLGSAPQQSNHSISLHKFLTHAIQERNSSVQPRKRNIRIKFLW